MVKRKTKSVRIFSLLIALLMVLPTLFSGSAYAQESDTRTIINTVFATSNTDSIPSYGKSFISPTFTVTEGAPANFKYSTGAWYKKNGDTWERNTQSKFVEGTYQYRIQVRIEGNDSKTHVLNKDGIDIKVNGSLWGKGAKPNISPTSSYTWARSPEYKVTAPVDAPLDFVMNSNWNIGDTFAGRAITPFSVASGAIGGTKPYTFSKVSGPNWLKVSSDGMVSGTPTLPGSNVGLRIRVTDNASATKEILLRVGSTNVVPGERIKITDIVATSNIDSIPGYGKSFIVPTFTVTEGAPANFKYSTGAWYKKNGDKWDLNTQPKFVEGTYQYRIQVRVEGNDNKTHVLNEDGINIKVNGNLWDKPAKPNISTTSSYTWARSPEYVITKPTPPENKHITSISMNVLNYALDKNASDVKPISKTEGVKIVNYGLYVYDANEDDWVPVQGTIKPEISYRLIVTIEPEDGYDFEGLTKNNITLGAIGNPLKEKIVGGTSQRKETFELPTWTAPVVPKEYKLTFDTDGGSSIAPITKKEGSTIILAPYVPTKAGHDFDGWYKDAQRTEKVKQVTLNKDMTVYAKWTAKPTPPPTQEFTITIDPSGGSWNGYSAVKTIKIKKGEYLTLPVAPTKDGYTFMYWEGSKYQPGDKYQVNDNHTFTAKWEKKSVKPDPDPQNPPVNPGGSDSDKPSDKPGTTPDTTGNQVQGSDTNTKPSVTKNNVAKATTPTTGENITVLLYAFSLLIASGGLLLLNKKSRKDQ